MELCESEKYIIIDTASCRNKFCECGYKCICGHTCVCSMYSRQFQKCHLNYYLNYWSKKGYILDKITPPQKHSLSIIAIMVKKEDVSDKQLCEEIKLLREAISYLPGIGSKFIEAKANFENLMPDV